LLFAFPAVRESFRKWPMASSTMLLVLAIALSHEIELAWDTNYLYHREAHWCAWAFCSGMVMATAASAKSRMLAFLIVVAATLNHFGVTSAAAYLTGGSALLLFVPVIPVPSLIKKVVSEIAAATLFMYLSHFQVDHWVTKIFHRPMPWIALAGAIIAGVVLARMYAWAERQVRTLGQEQGWRIPIPGFRHPSTGG
jgi:hypothetical protein